MIRNIFGCYVSYPSLLYDATEQQKVLAKTRVIYLGSIYGG